MVNVGFFLRTEHSIFMLIFYKKCCLSPVLFNLYSECLTREVLDGLGDFKIGGQSIQTVK